MLAIINAELVLRDHFLPDAYLIVEDGIIKDFGEMSAFSGDGDMETLDARGMYLAPGLVDIHSHTGGEFQAWKNPIEAARFHLLRGITTTQFLPRL